MRPESAAPDSTDLTTPAALQAMAALYAEGIGPFKDYILPTVTVWPPVDGDGDDRAQITRRLTGEGTQLISDAHAAGLQLHSYTLCDMEAFQALRPDGPCSAPIDEVRCPTRWRAPMRPQYRPWLGGLPAKRAAPPPLQRAASHTRAMTP